MVTTTTIIAINNSDNKGCWWKWKLYSSIVDRRNGLAQQTSKKQTKRLRFMLAGPWPCTFFVLCSLTMHELCNHNDSIGCLYSMSTRHQLLHFAKFWVRSTPRIANKNIQQRTSPGFRTIPLLTMIPQRNSH